MMMASFARSNRGLFGGMVGFLLVLFFISIYHVSGGDYDVHSLVNKWKGNEGSSKGHEDPNEALPHPSGGEKPPPPPEHAKEVPPHPPATPRPSFLEIAQKFGTDKVNPHHYNNMYTKYLEPLRDQPLKMLEIGLGCDMGYGPGASYHTWLEYLPHVDLYYIEYDAACAEKWADKTTGATIFAGDQADVAFLNSFLEKTEGNFDIIVDDGGHTMDQQKTSMDHLFKSVKPGGLYFVEDLETSYYENYGGGLKKDGTFVERVKSALDGLMGQTKHVDDVMNEVYSIDCMKEVCAFTKKRLTGVYGRHHRD